MVLVERGADIPNPETSSEEIKAPDLLPTNTSLTSIVFWRHIVGMMLLVMVAPPYGVSRTPSEFLGSIVGTMILPLLTTAIIIALGALFFTKQLEGKKGSLFIKIAWGMTFLGIYFINYGMRRY
jgi:hypothetical protein